MVLTDPPYGPNVDEAKVCHQFVWTKGMLMVELFQGYQPVNSPHNIREHQILRSIECRQRASSGCARHTYEIHLQGDGDACPK